MNLENPLVSAIIPTHNRADLLRRALKSVISQTYQPIEIIVVDDGSTDETESIVGEFKNDSPLIYLKNEEARGAPVARNKGIQAASGDFIAGLDDDDEWNPERIERLVQAYDDSFSCITSNVKMQYENHTATWHKQEIITLDDLLYSNQVGNQVLVKRDRLLEIGGFDEQLAAAQDYDLWIRLCEAFGPVKNIRRPLQIVHTEHEKGRISNPSSQLKGYLAFYKKHKHRMNRAQRKYQLYEIRRAQGKQQKLFKIFGWVPPAWYAKEAKRWVIDKFLAT